MAGTAVIGALALASVVVQPCVRRYSIRITADVIKTPRRSWWLAPVPTPDRRMGARNIRRGRIHPARWMGARNIR